MLVISKWNLPTSQVNLLNNIKFKNIYKVGRRVENVVFNEVGKGDSVIFFIPHQDDDVLSFSTILKRYIDKGCDVKVVLMANGSKSKARLTLNGEDNRICGTHGYLYNQ
ncbi:PIG-L family deacetylase [Romboutsia sp. MSSM.1001216sp_RTP31141st1_G3_RTP31141_220114]|uniref:PIG-L family deacetylase n=1 Tax=unclassified Romboutsia TaxID=2626894 RepID=UPI0031B5DD60